MKTRGSGGSAEPEPVDTPPPRQASEMSHAELAKAVASTPGLLDALDAALGSLSVERPRNRTVSHYQNKLKAALHAKTQEGKKVKTDIRGRLIWNGAAEAALLEAVPVGFEYTDFNSRDGTEVWRGIARRLDLDAKHAGALSRRYSDLTAAARRNPDGYDRTAQLAAAKRKQDGLQPGEVRNRVIPFYPNPSPLERDYALSQDPDMYTCLRHKEGKDPRSCCACERMANLALLAYVLKNFKALRAKLSVPALANHAHDRGTGSTFYIDAAVLRAMNETGATTLGGGGLMIDLGGRPAKYFHQLQLTMGKPLVLCCASSDQSSAAKAALKTVTLSGVEVSMLSLGGARGNVQGLGMQRPAYLAARAAADASFAVADRAADAIAVLAAETGRNALPMTQRRLAAVARCLSADFLPPRAVAVTAAHVLWPVARDGAGQLLTVGSCRSVAVETGVVGALGLAFQAGWARHVANTLAPLQDPGIVSVQCTNVHRWEGHPLDALSISDDAKLQANVLADLRRLLDPADHLNLTPILPGERQPHYPTILASSGVYAYVSDCAAGLLWLPWYTKELLPCTSNLALYRYGDFLLAFYATMYLFWVSFIDANEAPCVRGGPIGEDRFFLALAAVGRGEKLPPYAKDAFDAVPNDALQTLHRLAHSSATRSQLLGMYQEHAPLGHLRRRVMYQLLVDSQEHRTEIFRVAKILKPELVLPPAASCCRILDEVAEESFADAGEYADDEA